MSNALAMANNDVAQIVWHYDQKLAGCLGFAIFRKSDPADSVSEWEALPAWVGFKGMSNPAWTPRATTIWPIQKFQWKDLTAKRGGIYRYKVVPTFGQLGTDTPLELNEALALVTNAIELTPVRGKFRTYFNRGILSTQFLTHQIAAGPSGAPNYQILKNRIDQVGDPLRQALAGQLIEGIELLLKRVQDAGGECYLALYELNDPELIALLLASTGCHLILSNTGTDDQENQPARQAFHATPSIEVFDRFVPAGHIGHNKFCVYVDQDHLPRAVLLGSTNWTDTGLCAQSNNALIAEDAVIAQTYLDYWTRLRQDTDASGHGPQGAALRQSNAQAALADHTIDDGKATLWFSPNTPHARASRPGPDEATPPDLSAVFELMDQAKQAILFLEFEPGHPSIIDHAAEVANRNPSLFIRGATTDPKAAEGYNTILTHRTIGDEVNVLPATEVQDQFGYWEKELLKAGPAAHAIIHSKVIVIDPMSKDCVVITGSHNHGYRASYNNDENLMIVKGHAALAQAYVVHVLDIYDHYRFRYLLQSQKADAFSGLETTDVWQDKYYDPTNPASRDNVVWMP